MSYALDPRYKKAIIKAVEYHFPEAKIILFGSRARGDNRPGSDVDIAIDTGKRTQLRELSRLRITLEHLPIALNVDVVDMQRIPEEFKQTIAQEGVIWKS